MLFASAQLKFLKSRESISSLTGELHGAYLRTLPLGRIQTFLVTHSYFGPYLFSECLYTRARLAQHCGYSRGKRQLRCSGHREQLGKGNMSTRPKQALQRRAHSLGWSTWDGIWLHGEGQGRLPRGGGTLAETWGMSSTDPTRTVLGGEAGVRNRSVLGTRGTWCEMKWQWGHFDQVRVCVYPKRKGDF